MTANHLVHRGCGGTLYEDRGDWGEVCLRCAKCGEPMPLLNGNKHPNVVQHSETLSHRYCGTNLCVDLKRGALICECPRKYHRIPLEEWFAEIGQHCLPPREQLLLPLGEEDLIVNLNPGGRMLAVDVTRGKLATYQWP